LHLGLGFIQMLKAFTPTIVLLVLRLSGVSSPSRASTAFVSIIVVGTMFEVHGEMKLTAIGLVLMFTSELTEAVTMVFTQKLLQNEKFTIIETMYVLAPPGSACLILAAMITEWRDMIMRGQYVVLYQHPVRFLAAAALGVAVNFVGFMVVQATSSLTTKILNTARGMGLVFIGVLVYGEVITPVEMFGYIVSLIGVLGYNFVQVAPEQGAKLEASVQQLCCCAGV
jgi:drug/metabolite transporter (DMT)-like permease